MPELPEVETVVRALGPLLVGKVVDQVDVLSPSSVKGSPAPPTVLNTRTVETVWRRGKFILMDLSEGMGMAVHLRMTGWLGLRPRNRDPAKDDPHARLLFKLKDRAGRRKGVLVFRDVRKFGRVWCGTRDAILILPSLKKLGPDALEIGAATFRQRLQGRRGRVKSLLLNQTFLAGLGNIYTDEALFTARIHPEQAVHRIGRASADRLHAAIRDVLLRAVRAGGSSIDDFRHPDGSPGWFQRALQAYGRAGEPCGRCGRNIERITLGQRGTWFCPQCQRRRS